ncbi:unnamed protein product [Effrenium voratum]|nr:unnamed protein product [Effrenium voratum]
MQEQLRDLEYDDPDVMEAVRKVFGWRKRKILMEMSYGQFLSALEKTALSEEVRQDVAQGLYNRIQRGVPRTAPVLADASDIDIDFAPALEKAELDATGQFLETDEGSFKQHRDAEVWNDRKPESSAFNTEHFKYADNCGGRFFLPPWTLEEMLDDEAEAVNDRERLDEALQDPEALSNLRITSDMKVMSKTTHLLVKMRPTEGFERFAVNLSSDYVAQELVKRSGADNARELWKAMRAGMLTGTGPVLFEQELRNFMQDKGIKKFKLRARCLSDGREEDLLFNGALDAELASGNPKANVQPEKYYLPQKRNF